jgi:ATP-dependent DNA ligase
VRDRPLTERKRLLASFLVPGDPVLRGVHSIESEPAALIESVRELGLEGVVAKWAGARYTGGRSPLWRKLVLRRPTSGWRVEETGRRRRAVL